MVDYSKEKGKCFLYNMRIRPRAYYVNRYELVEELMSLFVCVCVCQRKKKNKEGGKNTFLIIKSIL